jgi:hypothetical protein
MTRRYPAPMVSRLAPVAILSRFFLGFFQFLATACEAETSHHPSGLFSCATACGMPWRTELSEFQGERY